MKSEPCIVISAEEKAAACAKIRAQLAARRLQALEDEKIRLLAGPFSTTANRRLEELDEATDATWTRLMGNA